MLGPSMVESNHDEERLARIEHLVEELQRESAAQKIITTKLLEAAAVKVQVVLAASRPRPSRRTA